jgi:hypothetical protein
MYARLSINRRTRGNEMRRITRALSITALALTAGAWAAQAAPPNGYSFSVVATLGTLAPGGDYHEGDFEPEHINGRGDVALASDLAVTQTDAVFGEALYGRYGGTTRLIARAGDLIPVADHNLKYATYSSPPAGGGILTPAGMNERGEIAYGFGIDGSRYAGVFRYDPVSETVSSVILPGDAAPDETTFQGSDFHTDLNNAGTIATVGVIKTTDGHCNDTSICPGLGRGVYTFDRFNNVAVIAAPGDPAPNSGNFDDAWNPNLNNGGDVIFGGHVKGEKCIPTGALGCTESLYLYTAKTRKLSSVAHQGQPAPGGGTFLIAANGRLNASGGASFFGTLKCNNDACSDVVNGLFLRKSDGTLLAVARPGDNLPGGTMKSATNTIGSHAIDSQGNVAFAAVLDNGATGVYLWSDGVIASVVATGTVIPNLGTVAHVDNEYSVGLAGPGVHMNEHGQILTQVILDNGANYVVVATPD